MRAVAITALVGLGIGQAIAGDATYTCTGHNGVRTVSVVTQTASGHGCEVRYDPNGRSEGKMLWHASNGTSFCVTHASTLLSQLGHDGWTCTGDREASAANDAATSVNAVGNSSGVTAATRGMSAADGTISYLGVSLRSTIH